MCVLVCACVCPLTNPSVSGAEVHLDHVTASGSKAPKAPHGTTKRDAEKCKSGLGVSAEGALQVATAGAVCAGGEGLGIEVGRATPKHA
jgi:hypothetical protein